MGQTESITIERAEVFPGRLRLLVRLAEGVPRFTTQRDIDAACAAYPTLLLHSCINAKGPTFGDVAVGTSVPHLLEHLLIAEQVNLANERGGGSAEVCESASPAASAPEATFVGTTEWTAGGPEGGKAIVEVSFVDDLEAITALARALAFLGGTTGT